MFYKYALVTVILSAVSAVSKFGTSNLWDVVFEIENGFSEAIDSPVKNAYEAKVSINVFISQFHDVINIFKMCLLIMVGVSEGDCLFECCHSKMLHRNAKSKPVTSY